jgi:hypothetical protein
MMMKLINTQSVQMTIKFRGKQIPKTETKYTYQTDDGAVLTFMASPKKAWTWDLYKDESNEKGLAQSTKIIDQHIQNLGA